MRTPAQAKGPDGRFAPGPSSGTRRPGRRASRNGFSGGSDAVVYSKFRIMGARNPHLQALEPDRTVI